jgi:hypothetical protein
MRICAQSVLWHADSLFAIEGLGQGNLGTNWGDGLATDPAYIGNSGASNPAPFFQALLGKPYR